ncbi:MAG: hypothetical protein IJS01_00970 [Lentisphaeria bacterium]|nr:hypothetical protein [Lentisphaeria bacterium]
MPRDNFISDNLINIRDRLRENYESRSAKDREPAEHSGAAPEREIHLDLKNPVVPPAGQSSRSPEREYNEFAGRLRHDLAAVGTTLEELAAKRSTAEGFRASLVELSNQLQGLTVQDSQDFFRELDRLKISYFQSAGKAAGLAVEAKTETAAPSPSPCTAGNYLPAVAILIGAAAVCVTLVLLFA